MSHEAPKNYLVQYKNYQAKVDRATNIRAKFERQIEAIEEGSAIAQSGNFMAKMRDELKTIATKASPIKITEIAEDSEMYVSEIEEADLAVFLENMFISLTNSIKRHYK